MILIISGKYLIIRNYIILYYILLTRHVVPSIIDFAFKLLVLHNSTVHTARDNNKARTAFKRVLNKFSELKISMAS